MWSTAELRTIGSLARCCGQSSIRPSLATRLDETSPLAIHFLCASAGLAEGHSRAFSVAGSTVLGVRRHGAVHLYRNRCPHRGIALNWGDEAFLDASASLIQCAHHGALFVVETGECVAGPCTGEWLQALDCVEDSQGIWLKA